MPEIMKRLRNDKVYISTVFILTLAIGLFCAGCAKGGDVKGDATDVTDKKIKIAATLFPQYDFARQIAGEYADVTLLLPPGMESHSLI